jgi:hypothetical protein
MKGNKNKYAKGGSTYQGGGEMADGGEVGKYSIIVWETEEDRDTGESFVAEILTNKKEALEKAEKMFSKQDFSAIEVIDENDEVILHLSSNEDFFVYRKDYAKGGSTSYKGGGGVGENEVYIVEIRVHDEDGDYTEEDYEFDNRKEAFEFARKKGNVHEIYYYPKGTDSNPQRLYAKGGKTTQNKYYTYDIVGDKVHIYQQNEEDENITDIKVGNILNFKDGETWKVVKIIGNKANPSRIMAGPYGKTRDRYISMPIEFTIDNIKKDVKSINGEDENSFDSIEQIITQLKNEGFKEKDFVVLKKDGRFAKGGEVGMIYLISDNATPKREINISENDILRESKKYFGWRNVSVKRIKSLGSTDYDKFIEFLYKKGYGKDDSTYQGENDVEEVGEIKGYSGGYDVTIFYTDGTQIVLGGGLPYPEALRIAKKEKIENDVEEVAVIVTDQSSMPHGEQTIRWIRGSTYAKGGSVEWKEYQEASNNINRFNRQNEFIMVDGKAVMNDVTKMPEYKILNEKFYESLKKVKSKDIPYISEKMADGGEIKDMSFGEFYDYLNQNDLGEWDNVNSEEIVRMYIDDMNNKDVNVSHIEEVLENNPSRQELYEIWLGNSMETPTPINTKEDLLEALDLDKKDYFAKGGEVGMIKTSKKAHSLVDTTEKVKEINKKIRKNGLTFIYDYGWLTTSDNYPGVYVKSEPFWIKDDMIIDLKDGEIGYGDTLERIIVKTPKNLNGQEFLDWHFKQIKNFFRKPISVDKWTDHLIFDEMGELSSHNTTNYAKGGEVKKKGNEMIIGGLAGILLGIFLNK